MRPEAKPTIQGLNEFYITNGEPKRILVNKDWLERFHSSFDLWLGTPQPVTPIEKIQEVCRFLEERETGTIRFRGSYLIPADIEGYAVAESS